METKVPASPRQRVLINHMQALLNPNQPLPTAAAWAETWKALQANPPADDVFATARANEWQSAGCAPTGAPHVIRGLLRQIDGDKPEAWQRTLAATFLDPKLCPAAAKLTDDDKARLIAIRDAPPPPQ